MRATVSGTSGALGRAMAEVNPAPKQCRILDVAMEASKVWHRDPEILGGTPVFVGTRVPVESLFDYLEAGDPIDEFLRQFPSVKREQAIAALDLARDSLLADARPA